jgi:hypothetical protein
MRLPALLVSSRVAHRAVLQSSQSGSALEASCCCVNYCLDAGSYYIILFIYRQKKTKIRFSLNVLYNNNAAGHLETLCCLAQHMPGLQQPVSRLA